MSDNPVIPLNNIVHVVPKEDLQLPEMAVVIEEQRGPYCPHEQIKVWPFYRVVECLKCKQRLDPFDYLLRLGQEERNLQSNIYWLRREVKQLNEEKEQLKKQVTMLKSQRRKLS